MKLFDFAIIIALSSAFTVTSGAEFYFKEPRVKFADTKAGEIITHTWHFTNSGTDALIISGYNVACSCTQIIYPEQPIAPGESGTVQLSFDTKGKYGLQMRKIEILSNAGKGSYFLSFKVYILE